METKHKPRHSVLVLTYKKASLIEARIAELTHFFSHRDDVEFVIFDNGATDPATRLVVGSASMRYRSDRRWVFGRVDGNLGFGGGWNAAVKMATGDKLYLLSDDVEILGDFITPILERTSDLTYGVIVGQTLVHGHAGWNEFQNTPPISYLNGHFLAMDHATFLRLGGFDSDTFHPYDYEDIDLCYRAQHEHGWSLTAIPELPLRHGVAGTIGYNPDRFDHTVAMRARFAAKHNLINWPEIP